MNQHPVILFDGVCNYCNTMVNFVIRQDKQKKFHFATIQSEGGIKLLSKYGIDATQLESFVFIDKNKAYMRSSASLKVMENLPWYWKWTGIFWVVPKFMRDAVYDLIARNRYKWFGKKEVCMVPTPELRNRFL